MGADTGKRERPILFSGPMVRAILAGRKTQTRRVIPAAELRGWASDADLMDSLAKSCRYGAPGDRLWVRETWQPRISHACAPGECDCADVNVIYAADRATAFFPGDRVDPEWTMPKVAALGYVTPLHLPRWASRLTLEVTGVRVERLQDISERDCWAEGLEEFDGALDEGAIMTRAQQMGECIDDARPSFAVAWDSLNTKRPGCAWADNPWVWVVEFRRVEAEARHAG